MIFQLLLLILYGLFTAPRSGALPQVRRHSAVNSCLLRADFIPAEQALADLRLPLNIMAATPSIAMITSERGFLGTQKMLSSHCSSSITSDSGFRLASAHCFERCIHAAGGYKVLNGIHVIDKEKLNKITCKISVNGKTGQARLWAVSDCDAADLEASDKAPKCRGLDYALFTVDGDSIPASPCLPSRDGPIKVDEDVLNVGFPAATSRRQHTPSARDSFGDGQYISTGKVVDQSTCLLKPIGDPELYKTLQDTGLVNGLVVDISKVKQARKDFVQTTTDGTHRSSGSALVDRSGQQVGVLSSMVGILDIVECRGATFYSSIQKIKDAIKSDYPAVDLSDAFRCARNSALK